MTTKEKLADFAKFAEGRLISTPAEPIEKLFFEWRANSESLETAEAVRESLAAVERGEFEDYEDAMEDILITSGLPEWPVMQS